MACGTVEGSRTPVGLGHAGVGSVDLNSRVRACLPHVTWTGPSSRLSASAASLRNDLNGLLRALPGARPCCRRRQFDSKATLLPCAPPAEGTKEAATVAILVRRETLAGPDRRKSLRGFNPISRTAIAVLAGRPTACIQAPSAPIHSVSQAWRKASLAAGTAIRACDKRGWQANHALHRHPNGPWRRRHLPVMGGFINRRAWEMALASCAQEVCRGHGHCSRF